MAAYKSGKSRRKPVQSSSEVSAQRSTTHFAHPDDATTTPDMAALFHLQHADDRPMDQEIAQRLRGRADDVEEPSLVVRALIEAGLDRLPPPGHGATLDRWRALAAVARFDLSTAKLFESHTDALAILHELDRRSEPRRSALHAVWASESPATPLRIRRPRSRADREDLVVVDGSKAWCSGAASVDVGLVTAVDEEGRRWLVEIVLAQPGITIDDGRWQAVGMAATGTADIRFEGVEGRVIGHSNAYLDRAGFWHGGAGIAACWFGAAADIGTRVRDLQRARPRDQQDPHARALLATIDARLAAAAALIRECAASIDAEPSRDVRREVLRLRAAVVDTCERVLQDALRALGPGPFCTDRRLARHAADLPVFLRQMRGAHDLVAQADALFIDEIAGVTGWVL